MTNPNNPGAGRWMTIGDAIGQGLAQATNNFISTTNTYDQQRQAQANILADQQFRQAQADEQKRINDRLFDFQVDQVAYDRVTKQYDALVGNLKAGAFDKDPLLKQRATYALSQAGKLQSMIGKGQRPDATQTADYDQMWGDFGALAAAAGINLGVNAARRDDAMTTLQVNTAGMSDAELQYTRETLPKKIEGFNAQQDVGILQRNILAVLAPYQSAQGKAEALAKIAGLGGTSAGAVQGLLTEGLIDPDTAKVLETRMGQVDTTNKAGVDTAVAQAGLSELELDKVKKTFDSTVNALNSGNNLTVQKNTVVGGLLNLESAASRAEYLGRIAAQGETGVAVIDGLIADGVITSDVGTAAKTKASRVATTEQTQLDVLMDQAGITSNERQFSDDTLSGRTELFNSDKSLRVKTNAAEIDLLGLKSAGQRGAYLQGLAKMGDGGMAIISGLAKSGVITQEQATAFGKTASNAQKVDDAGTRVAVGQAQLTEAEVQKVKQTLTTTIAAINATNGATVARQQVIKDLATLEGAAQRTEYLKGIARSGAVGSRVIDALEKDGTITSDQATAARQTAANAQTVEDNAADQSTAQTGMAEDEARKSRETLTSTITQINSTNNLATQTDAAKQGLLALQTAAQEADYLGGIAKLGATGVSIIDQLQRQGIISPEQARAARKNAGNVQTVEDNNVFVSSADRDKVARTLDSTINALNSNNNLEIKTNAVKSGLAQLAGASQRSEYLKSIAGAGSMGGAIVDALEKQGIITRAEATSARKNATIVQTSIQIAADRARTEAAALMDPEGNTLANKTGMRKALERMQIGNAQLLQTARSNYRLVVDKLLPNAKFSVDKYDPKNFSTLVGNAANLTPEQKQELQGAAGELQARISTAQDLNTAFGQNEKGRIDPQLAGRLGIPTGDASGNDGAAGLAKAVSTPGTDLRKLGFTGDALNNTKAADGSWISYCTRFARQFTELSTGAKPYSLGEYFKGTATETRNAFERKNALTLDNVSPARALENAGSLKEGDMIFLNYGNSKIDHVAVYDGKGGIIQHSLPGFRGQTVEGAVNTMSLEQFLNGAGKATVSFGRVGGVKAGPVAPTTGRPQPTPATQPTSTVNIGGQVIPPAGIAKINSAILNLANTPAEKRGGQAQVAAQALSRELATLGVKGLTTQQVLTFLGSTGGQTLSAGSAGAPGKGQAPQQTDVTGTLQARSGQLTNFYAAVRKAPNAQVATKMLHDQAIVLAGGPNAPQALKAQYFDALLATSRNPASPTSTPTGVKPLTIQQAKPLIQQAPNGTALETIKAQLIAAGMPANDAAQYIRDVKSGRK